MQIHRLPALRDNYIFLLHDPKTGTATVVDPAEPEPVFRSLKDLGARLTAILNTHHHGDHVGANLDLLQSFPEVVVYGGAEDRGRIPHQQRFLQEGDRIVIADRTAEVLFVPGHTRAHIAYYFPPLAADKPGDLFCGDTLFAGGCGRLFEGTPAQMVQSLSKIRNLPDNTRVWCAHEYTLRNLEFAVTIEPNNSDLTRRLAATQAARYRHEPTIPSTLGIEKLTNPFLRWDAPAVQQAMQSANAVETFARLRRLKDQF